jgi:hypothetical protein
VRRDLAGILRYAQDDSGEVGAGRESRAGLRPAAGLEAGVGFGVAAERMRRAKGSGSLGWR